LPLVASEHRRRYDATLDGLHFVRGASAGGTVNCPGKRW
jgi:hypothetical protein